MLRLPKKLMITLMATVTVLGVGAGIGQLPSVSARHIRTYRVRRHRTYRHRRFHRHAAKRTRRTKRTKRVRRTKRSRRTTRKLYRSREIYEALRAYKPKHSRRYVRKHARRRVIRRHAHRVIKAPRRTAHLQNMFSEFTPAQLRHIAKLDYEPLNEFESDDIANNNGHIYGPARVYNLDSELWIFTKPGLSHYAEMNHVSVPQALKLYEKHATKYWNWNGNPTKLAIQTADQDAINNLNQDREAQGIQPLTPDPGLQLVAEKRSQQMNYQGNHNETISHNDSQGNFYAGEIARKYNVTTPYGENIAGPATTPGEYYANPSKIANEENTMWDASHEANRMSPNYNYVGISVNGSTAEEFA